MTDEYELMIHYEIILTLNYISPLVLPVLKFIPCLTLHV